jgi:hypothetical protein
MGVMRDDLNRFRQRRQAYSMLDRLVASCLFLTLSTPVVGATIDAAPLGSTDFTLVTVTGPFELSDIESFRTKTSFASKAIVSFASDGGNLSAGIEIGTALRLRGFLSLVPDGARCASACALAWLGGAKRLMGKHAQVGFHSASLRPTGQSIEMPSGDIGNALIGAYLNRIGLPDRAIVYITQAAPEAMTWLSLDDAAQQGIEVSLFAPDEQSTIPNILQPQPQPAPNSTQPSSSLTAEEIERAHRLARNFLKRYRTAGMAGLHESVGVCYKQALAAENETSAKYCIALDFITARIDYNATKALKVDQLETNNFKSAYARAIGIMNALTPPLGLETVYQSILVANRAQEEISETQPQPVPPDTVPAQSATPLAIH